MKFIFTDDSIFLGYDAMSKGNQFPALIRHIAPSSSAVERSKNLVSTILLLCPVSQVQTFSSKYSSQYSPSMLFPYGDTPSFTPIQQSN
jgi:hypothetical protein